MEDDIATTIIMINVIRKLMTDEQNAKIALQEFYAAWQIETKVFEMKSRLFKSGDSAWDVFVKEVSDKLAENELAPLENILKAPTKIQSTVWQQKQSGSKNTVPKSLPTMCFTTQGNKLK